MEYIFIIDNIPTIISIMFHIIVEDNIEPIKTTKIDINFNIFKYLLVKHFKLISLS